MATANLDLKLKHTEFVPNETWPSCYVYRQLNIFRTVCIVDFEMRGLSAHLKKGLCLIQKVVDAYEPALPTYT